MSEYEADESMDVGDVFMDSEIKEISKFPYEFLKKAVKADKRALIDLNKEYGLLLYYNDYDSKNKILKLFRLVTTAIADGQCDFLSLSDIKNSFDQYFKYLEVKKKYDELVAKAGSILGIDYQGFSLNEFTFETLDEVERALDNKMFL
jgi:hypothetical protein